MQYTELIPRSSTRPAFQVDAIPNLQQLSYAIRLGFNGTTLLAIGAFLQALLVLLPIPKYYAIGPCIAYLLFKVTSTYLVTYGIIANPYLKGAIPHKYSAIVPDKYGNFPAQDEVPTKEKVAVLILGVRVNHPGGWFASPHVEKMGQLFQKMSDDLTKLPQAETGCLGQNQAYVPTGSGAVEICNISYWRSKEHILKYADSPAHREALQWWREMDAYNPDGSKVPHIGINHEIYESNPGQWESIYMNYQPTMLGATSYEKASEKLENGTVPKEWISPIVDARRGKLAGTRGRLGLTSMPKAQ